MSRTINYQSGCPVFTYFLFHPLNPGEFKKVSEDTFYAMVRPFLRSSPYRDTIKIVYDKDDRRRQNYIFNGSIVGYRLR